MTSGTLCGLVNPEGEETLTWFEWGATTNLGLQTTSQFIGSSVTSILVNAVIPTFESGPTNYFRCVAANENGTNYGVILPIAKPVFEPVETSIVGVAMGAVAWGDYDNDGDLDLLLGGLNGTNALTIIYRNDNGLFTDIKANLPGISAGAVAWGDHDNDGDLDLLIADGASLRVFRNEGNDRFELQIALPSVGSVGGVDWSDFDNDGDIDILVAGSSVSPLYRNDRDAGYTGVSGLQGGYFQSSIATADYDNDGDLDVALIGSHYYGPVGYMFKGRNGRLVWAGEAFGIDENGSLAWADYDNDGDFDLLLTGSLTFAKTQLYLNNGAGSLTLSSVALPGVSAGMASWGDYDNDGRPDVLLIGEHHSGGSYGPYARVLRNTGGFVSTADVLPGSVNGAVAWGDFDSDGRLDFVLLSSSGSDYHTYLYWNRTESNTAIPEPPKELQSSVTGLVANLSWQIDANKPRFTYNLRVGSSPGGIDIVSPMADLNTGRRLLPKYGNAGLRNTWSLRNLRAGVYYWSVQSVDQAFAGGPFAPEMSFAISEPRFLAVQSASNNQISMILQGDAGQNYSVEVSSNLVIWMPWKMASMSNSTVTLFDSLLGPNRFYRARLASPAP